MFQGWSSTALGLAIYAFMTLAPARAHWMKSPALNSENVVCAAYLSPDPASLDSFKALAATQETMRLIATIQSRLTPLEQKVLRLHFGWNESGESMGFGDIGDSLSISRQAAHQALKNGIIKLQRALGLPVVKMKTEWVLSAKHLAADGVNSAKGRKTIQENRPYKNDARAIEASPNGLLSFEQIQAFQIQLFAAERGAWQALQQVTSLSVPREVVHTAGVNHGVVLRVFKKALNDLEQRAGFTGLKRQLREVIALEERYLDTLFSANEGLVYKTARLYAERSRLDYNDLKQVGLIGLYKAAERFDSRMGYEFSTYAMRWIKTALSDENSENGRTIRVPRNELLDYYKYVASKRALAAKLSREPLPKEIAKEMKLSLARIKRFESIASQDRIDSLDKSIDESGKASLMDTLEDASAPDIVGNLVRASDRKALQALMRKTLNAREIEVVELYFGFNENGKSYTFAEIGARFGLTKQRIEQILSKALAKMRNAEGKK